MADMIQSSPQAEALRHSVHAKECWCTNEVFLWPSINYQPVHLAKTLLSSRAWTKAEVLDDAERMTVFAASSAPSALRTPRARSWSPGLI